jgi:hypothetical protein
MYPPPEAYIHFSDQIAQRLFLWGYPLRIPCVKRRTENGFEVYASIPADQCLKFTKPQRMHGLWRNDFEGSQFCPAHSRECSPSASGSREQTWFDQRFSLPPQYKRQPPGGLYEVEFIGRRSQYSGMYGHFGMFNQEVIADRLISLKEIQPPPEG